MSNHSDIVYKAALSTLKGVNIDAVSKIIETFGSERNFMEADDAAIRNAFPALGNDYFRSAREKAIEKAAKECAYADANNIKLLYFSDDAYPVRLRDCSDAPVLLYTCGDCNLNAAHVVSIVGTRHATPYGATFTDKLIKELSEKLEDLLIISGLAYGIDITAHRACINYGVKTAAVFGCGLGTVYPSAHRNDAAAIVRNGGMVMTEYAHATSPFGPNFLERNRIVAGIADCTVVVESAFKGGSMSTARLASAYSRDVFALPGRIGDTYSQGCNKLISNNVAHLIDSADTLIAAMNWTAAPAAEGHQHTLNIEFTSEEEVVINHLRANGEQRLNAMTAALDWPMRKLLSVLMNLEFKQAVVSLPGSLYRLV